MSDYIKDFEKLGFGMFVHFGLYSILGKGEWAKHLHGISDEKYFPLANKFKVNKNWASELVKAAKAAGCKYITITTRHHDGFSLYDTKGLSSFDAPNSAAKRDLIAEFVDECNKSDIVPFFYHTLLDWHNTDYENNFGKYIDYLVKSVEILCTSYGKIGGFWFDGMWDKKDVNWQEDRLYQTIRKHQPKAMIINNTGLSELGKVGHFEIDSVTFERGNPQFVDNSDKYRAGEMCQVLNDHWGFAKTDVCYKSVKELIGNLLDCRKFGCNFLLNVGLLGSGSVKTIDKCIFKEIGKWIKFNKNIIYNLRPCDIKAENAVVLKDDRFFYAIISDVPMEADPNVALAGKIKLVKVGAKIKRASWLDNDKVIEVKDNTFYAAPFKYGTSMGFRVAKLELKNS